MAGSAPRPARPFLRVATLNVWGAYHEIEGSGIGLAPPGPPWPPAWERRQAVLRDGLRRLDPDLVAFQEVIAGDYDQVADLLGPGYHSAHQTAREPDGSGTSIASRWPLARVHEVDLHVTERTAGFPCGTLVVEVDAPAPFGPLLFANHVPNWQPELEYERESQAVVAARAIEDLAGGGDRHVVVGGDFDAGPEAASLRFWCGLQSLRGVSVCYADAWALAHPGEPGHTVSPRNPLRSEGTWPLHPGERIDHLLVRYGGNRHGPTLAVAACSLLFDEPAAGVWASDHFGVTADLTVAPQPGVTSG